MQRVLWSHSRNAVRNRLRAPLSRNVHSTPLEKLLVQSIKATGPIPVSHYMKMCLAHPSGGYYMQGDVFGTKGDFITSPEISQTFGEVLAVWLASRWLASGTSLPIRFIELGPGRGTLTADIVRTLRMFKAIAPTPIDVHLIETSLKLREVQQAVLDRQLPGHQRPRSLTWHEGFEEIMPSENPAFTMIVAHELFDALPVQILDKSEGGFSEVLVGLKEPLPEPETDETPFRFVKSPVSSPGANLLAASSPRFIEAPAPCQIEVSPESWKTARAISKLLAEPGGGAGLIVDYGDDHFASDSFRAFQKHKSVSPFHQPGLSDLTANVDFAYIREALQLTPSTRALGPMTQRDFLLSMGLELRVQKLASGMNGERRKDVEESAERLVSMTGMGRQYKVMGVVSAGAGGEEVAGVEDVYPFGSP